MTKSFIGVFTTLLPLTQERSCTCFLNGAFREIAQPWLLQADDVGHTFVKYYYAGATDTIKPRQNLYLLDQIDLKPTRQQENHQPTVLRFQTRYTMKYSIRTLLVLVGLISSTTLFAQLKVTTQISSDANTGKQLIQATVTGGSGQYSYAWGLNTPGVVPPNSASAFLLTPAQEAEYIVFVRDKQTGASTYSTVAVKALVTNEKHLIRMPGKDYKMNSGYSAAGALPDSQAKK